MRLAQPLEAEHLALAHLLVGGRREDQVAGRLEPLARERRDRDRVRRHLALHVERAAAPDAAVPQLARPRVDRPLGRVGEDGVGVREQEQRRPVARPPDPRDEVRPLGHARVELALDAERLEVRAQELGRLRLVAGRVDGVQADQRLEEPDDLVAH